MFQKLIKQIHTSIRLLLNKRKEPYFTLYPILGFYPDQIQLYEEAFRHSSASVQNADGQSVNNERLEFLGDGLLDCIVADILFKRYPQAQEGFLTISRAKVVQRDTLDKIAMQIGLTELVIFSSKINTHNNHIYGNAFEALVGAIYLDKGYATCFRFVERLIDQYVDLEQLTHQEINFKSSLLEWGQKHRVEIFFELVEQKEDAKGNKTFRTVVRVTGGREIGEGCGFSKKESQQQAAQAALNSLRASKALRKQIYAEKKAAKEAEAAANEPQAEENKQESKPEEAATTAQT